MGPIPLEKEMLRVDDNWVLIKIKVISKILQDAVDFRALQV